MDLFSDLQERAEWALQDRPPRFNPEVDSFESGQDYFTWLLQTMASKGQYSYLIRKPLIGPFRRQLLGWLQESGLEARDAPEGITVSWYRVKSSPCTSPEVEEVRSLKKWGIPKKMQEALMERILEQAHLPGIFLQRKHLDYWSGQAVPEQKALKWLEHKGFKVTLDKNPDRYVLS